tara:strand:+ start:91 stop:1002 length:912 start_codon:yes stop_codon:yes gene_type:complete
MKRYLITGGCGFIGQHLIKNLLKKKCIIDIIDLPKKKNFIRSKYINSFKGDISNKNIFKKLNKKYDVAFHLAAQTSGRLSEIDSEKDIYSNVVGSLNFCEWAKLKKPKRVVFTSSMSVYGKIANNAKENENCKPVSIYGLSKLYSEKLFERLKKYKIKVTIFRLFNIYGPGQDLKNLYQGMFSIYLAQALKKNRIEVTGSLNRYRDFVYISDTIDALLINPKKKDNWLMNLGLGKKYKVKNVIDIILRELNNKKIKIIERNSFIEDTLGSYANNSKLRSEGWRPKYNLEMGARKTIYEIKKKK